MARRLPPAWLPRLLFRCTILVAILLVALVALSPWLDDGKPSPQGWLRFVVLFARDATVRRTALGSAVGLSVTACVFFKSPSKPASDARKSTRLPPPKDVIGA